MSAQFVCSPGMSRTAPLRRARAVLGGVVGILALLLQMLPALAASDDGMWIEICSDLGPVMMQIDTSEGDSQPACPDCDDCALCSTTAVSVFEGDHVDHPEAAKTSSIVFAILPNSENLPRHLRPVTRGPPQVTQNRAARAPRLSPALTPVNGDAPWT